MNQNHTSGAIVDGKLRTINEFSDTDRKLDFRCPKCKEPLILRLRKTRNHSHFAHKPDSNFTGAQESAYHLLAKEMLKETKTLYFPEVSFKDGNEIHFFKKLDDKNVFDFLYGWVNNELKKTIKQYDSPEFKEFHISSTITDIILSIQPVSIKSQLIKFDNVEIEDEYNDEEEKKQKSVFFRKYGFMPDAVGYVKDKQGVGKEVIVEFFYTHKVDAEKLQKIKEQNLPCIEIDISKLELDKLVLKNFLESKDCNAKYLNNPKANEIRSNFLKVIEDKVIYEVEKVQSILQKKNKEIKELKELNYIEIPSTLNIFFGMETFCPRTIEKKQEYRKTKFYNETIVKDVIDNGWNLSWDYDRSYYEKPIGMTLYKNKEERKIKFLSANFKAFFSDYFRKMRSTDGCKGCKFYREVDVKNEFCGSPDVKPFKEIEKLADLESYGANLLNNLGEVNSPLQLKSTNIELTGKPKFNQYNIKNREDFFK